MEDGPKIGLRMGAFLSQPDILRLGEDMCQHFAQIVLYLNEERLHLGKGLLCIGEPKASCTHDALLRYSEGSSS